MGSNGTLRRYLTISWVVTIVLFTLARCLVAREALQRYGLNIWVFMAIDLVTALPYAIGVAKVVTSIIDRDSSAASFWALVAGASFLAPYGYIAWAGRGASFPPVVYVVLGVMIVLFGANAVRSVRRSVRNARTDDVLDVEPSVA
jgi:hypothetical protein